MDQPGGRGYPLKSRLREPTNPLSHMTRFHRAVCYCAAGLHVAGLPVDGLRSLRPGCPRPSCEAHGRAAEPVAGLPAAEMRSPRGGLI